MIDGVYKIRSWESMENEYGIDEYGDILISEDWIWVMSSMKENCGKEVYIVGGYTDHQYCTQRMTIPKCDDKHEQVNQILYVSSKGCLDD